MLIILEWRMWLAAAGEFVPVWGWKMVELLDQFTRLLGWVI